MKVRTTSQYDRAEKRYSKKHYPIEKIADCVDAIIKQDINFLKKHKDYSIGEVRELHIDRQYNDDWLLIYRINQGELELLIINMGNHNQLKRMVN